MALTAGTRLGHYDVTALLGEGGMGCGKSHKTGLSGFPNAETLNLTMSYVDVGLIGHRVQTRKGPV